MQNDMEKEDFSLNHMNQQRALIFHEKTKRIRLDFFNFCVSDDFTCI